MATTARQTVAQFSKNFAFFVFSLLAGLALLVAALWWWAGTDGSLASALRWADDYTPHLTKNLMLENPSGSLRAGGHVDRLIWQQNGLKIDATDVALAWQPWVLVSSTLKLDGITATSVLIDDQRPKTTSIAPPESLRLPVRVVLDAFAITKLSIAGATAFSASDIVGNYSFDGQQHKLELARATMASGSYRGAANMAADTPFALSAALAGSVTAALPDSQKSIPLAFDATLRGTLADMQARASLHLMGDANSIAITDPKASATARITPWAVQPIPQVDAVFKNLNVAAFWPSAPQTLLTGSASVAPVAGSVAAWALQLQATNKVPGPWDKARLPITAVAASAEWRDGMALVKSFHAKLGGGELVASGQR